MMTRPAISPATPTSPTAQVHGVTKRYGSLTALDGVALTLEPGSIVGLLGPNGAGKTTLLEILCGLRGADAGTVEALGMDPSRHRQQLALRLGMLTQEFGLPSAVRTREALDLFARLYPHPLDVDELLIEVDLADKARARFRELSGGQRRRLALAKALVGNPELVVLDEPTAALDPQGRDFLRERIRSLREQGRSVLLSTHDIGDAQLLCDRVVILDHGRIVSSGSVSGLVERHTAAHVLRLRAGAPLPPDPDFLQTDGSGDRVVYTDDPRAVLDRMGPDAERHLVELRHTTLEDVFLHLTGRQLRP